MIKKSTRDSILSILKTSLRINKKLNDVFKKYEISEQQFNILRILRGQRGKPSSLKRIQKITQRLCMVCHQKCLFANVVLSVIKDLRVL